MKQKPSRPSAAVSRTRNTREMKLSKICLITFLAFIAIPEARAQLPQTDAFAAQVAHGLSHFKGKQVIVFDFIDSSGRLTALGQYLADNFSAALTKSTTLFQVMDRSKIRGFLEDRELQLVIIAPNTEMAIWIGHELGMKAVIVGRTFVEHDNLNIELDVYEVESAKHFKNFSASFPITNDMRSLMGKTLEDATKFDPNIPDAKSSGYALPKCIHCPPAIYSKVALNKRVQGTVTLAAIIGIDGKAHQIIVLKGQPYGLTDQAARAVSQWTFKPALNPNGDPAPVRQTIEVTFHLY
jgi:TonB family protein